MRALFAIPFLVIYLLSSVEGNSQPSEITYQGTLIKSGYTVDASYGPFDIGFNFMFYGNSYSQFYVNTNGLVLFGSGSTDGTEDPVPSATVPNNFIAALWDQLVISSSGKMLYKTIGAAPNRKLIIQATNMAFYPIPIFMGTYQVVLYETSNKIQVQYRIIIDATSARAHGESATIGIENSTGSTGVQYSYHDPSAISTGKAVSFLPSGPSYIMDTDAIYDGVVLTSNITLPDPGIPLLLSPAQDAIIGSGHKFEWAESSDAASYSLLISTAPDLGGGSIYNAGTSLSYDITGLSLNTTYYWGVFASNATGTTWCEIKKFTTSATPPLAAVPRTLWIEQNQDKTIILNYTGGDTGPKTAIITSLPAQGALFQYSAGIKGSQIISIPMAVSDPGRRVIYSAPASSGNGIGNFNFKMNDGTGDSPEAGITVNVSPPGIPGVLYVAKGSGIEIQFDRIMADPSGKHGQFTATVNGTPATISSASLKAGDQYTIVLTLSIALTGSETVSIAYTQGDVTSEQGGVLLSFTDIPVTLRSQAVTFTQTLDKKFNQSPFNLTATAGSGLSMTYSSSNLGVATITGSQVTLRSTGTSDITARQAGNATWAPAKYIRTLTVSKGDQTITFSPLPSKTYGDADFNLTATASSGLTMSYSSSNPGAATVAGNTVHITGAGSTVITASQAGNTLWNPAPDVQQSLTVGQSNAAIILSGLNHVYDGLPCQVTASTTPSGLLVDITYDGLAGAPVNAGSYSVIATINDPNYQGTTAGTLVIAKAALTATADDKSRVYGEDNPVFTISYAGFVNSEDVNVLDTRPTVSSTADASTAPGTVPITVTGGADNNYDFNYTDGVLTIIKATATVIPSNLSAVYNGQSHTASATTIPAGLTVDFTYNGSQQPPVDAGSYAITGIVNDVYYQGTATGTIVIAKAPLTFTAENKTREYLAANPPLTRIITGFIGNDTEAGLDVLPSIQTSAVSDSPAGSYPITLAGGNDNNYTYIYIAGTLTVTRIGQTITITGIPDRLLAGDSYTLEAESTSGLEVLFESGDEAIATVTGNQLTGVSKGSAEIRAYNAGDNNYEPVEAFATVEIHSTHANIMHLFTPNNDGINDYWELPDRSSWGKCDVRVYNRWGKLVFADPDYNNLWDGTSGGAPLPEGAYYFIIDTGNAGVVKGTVNIVR